MHLTADGLSELFVSLLAGGSLMVGVVAASLRFAVRPLLEDWFRLRSQAGAANVERRLLEMEEEIRQLKAAAGLQLPAETLRSVGQPRT